MNLGFNKAPSNIAIKKPDLPNYSAIDLGSKKIIRPSGAVRKSLFPRPRPSSNLSIVASTSLSNEIEKTLRMLNLSSLQQVRERKKHGDRKQDFKSIRRR